MMPIGMAAILVGIVVLAVIYAMLYQGGSGYTEGARFGALIGLFVVCAFVVHNYLMLNIGGKLAFQQSVAYFLEWTVTGIVIGLDLSSAGYALIGLAQANLKAER